MYISSQELLAMCAKEYFLKSVLIKHLFINKGDFYERKGFNAWDKV